MSLLTDIAFISALRQDVVLLGMLQAGDVYNTSIALPDENLDNAPLPYIIVSYDGMVNDQQTKDDLEGPTDTVDVTIEIAAKTRRDLGIIAARVRKTVHDFFSEKWNGTIDDDLAELIPDDYQLTASGVQYDSLKPCYWQTLGYQCDTKNDNYGSD